MRGEWRAGGWVAVSNRPDEVGDVILDAVGMGLAQFAKVALLPQGDFAAFLRASPEERREVLERLFDIATFAEVEDWLADARRDGAAELERRESTVAAELTRVTDLVGTEPELLALVPPAELAAVRKLALGGLLPLAKAWSKAAAEKTCEVTGTKLDDRLTVLKQGRALLEAAVAGVDAREQVLAVHRVGLLMGQCKGAGMVGLVVGQSLQQNAINVAHWLWNQGGLDGPGRAATGKTWSATTVTGALFLHWLLGSTPMRT